MTAHAPAELGARPLMRNPPVLALLAAEVVSTTGSLMSSIALPWFVLATTHSPSRSAYVVAAEVSAVALTGVPSGALGARLGARTTMLVSDLANAPLVALVPLLYRQGLLTFPLLLALSFTAGLFVVPFTAAQEVIVPELMGSTEETVARTNAVLQGATRLTYLLGPALGGILIGFFGAANVLLIDGATYAVSFALIALFVPAVKASPRPKELRGLLAGVRFLRRDRLLRPLTLGQAGSQMAFQGLMLALPVLAFERYDHNARLAGFFAASWGGGALAGTLLAYRVVSRFDSLTMGAIAWVGYGLSLWLLVPRQPAAALFAPLVLSGICNGLRNPPLSAIRVLSVPPPLRPQTSAASSTIATLGGALALAIIGSLIRQAGLTAVFALIAAISTAGAFAFAGAALRAVRERASSSF
jgi:MFS family permease